jgi:hypothetical protein
MNSRERVFKSLEFSCPDRAPRNLWKLPWVDMFATEEARQIANEFPDDFIGPAGPVFGKSEKSHGVIARKRRYVDDWGCVWESAEDGVVGEVTVPLLENWSDLENLRPPIETIKNANLDIINYSQDENLKSSNPKFMFLTTSIRPFERMQFLRGTESLFMDLGLMDGNLRKLRDIVHEFFISELSCLIKTGCDGLCFIDDWGSQNSLLISPDLWRQFYKPLYKDYCDMIHSAGKKVFFHSDGNIMAIYEDLIGIGVDAIIHSKITFMISLYSGP